MTLRVKPGSTVTVDCLEKTSRLKAFIDTNVFVYAIELHPTYGEIAGRILSLVDLGELDGFTSSLVIMEICWYLESRKRFSEMQEIIDLITGSRMHVLEIELQDIKRGAEDKSEYQGIDLNDLINYNLMKRQGIETIYTNDSHFQRLHGLETRFS